MKVKPLLKHGEKLARLGRVRTLASLRELAVIRSWLCLPRNEVFALRTSQADGVTQRLVDPEEPFRRRLPEMPGEPIIHWSFRKEQNGSYPASFVAEVKNARFWGHYGGMVFTRDGRLIPEVSKDVWGPDLHSAYTRLRFPPTRPLPGRTLSLVTPEAAGNYHHWTVDLIPRAGLAEKAGFALNAFDHVLVKDRALPYQVEALRRLGIKDDRVIRVQDNTHLHVEHLVVPAVRHDNTRVSPRDILYTRGLFLPEEPPRSAARRRLYVSRRDASFRRVLNEEQVLPILREHGFEEVAMSKLSVAQQAQLFSETEFVVAPNGSALANLVYANRACRVLEFFAPGWIVGYNWMLCDALGMQYVALIGEGERPPQGTLPRDVQADIVLDPVKLKAALQALFSSSPA